MNRNGERAGSVESLEPHLPSPEITKNKGLRPVRIDYFLQPDNNTGSILARGDVPFAITSAHMERIASALASIVNLPSLPTHVAPTTAVA